ncbi:MAG TPA: hypothetical protein VI997_10740 [Candidatus Thermoplasmatota archaeon]|nr:hypothetical protein [Candidatus Thermoplasmatota archaeon]
MALSLQTWQGWAILAALALGLILAWKFMKLAFKVVVVGIILASAYVVGRAAGWWG